MPARIIGFNEPGATHTALVGGKGAQLGVLSGMKGITVPEGCCVTTAVYDEVIAHHPALPPLLHQLHALQTGDLSAIRETCAQIRREIEAMAIPPDIEQEIARRLESMGNDHSFAVRSSATSEDLPSASFAGQQDTFLNISGAGEVLRHILKCWASLYTERAVIYRMQQGFAHHKVSMAVVIQRMIFPDVAGILFTADPVSSNRKILSIDASFGLGEALVAGIVNADNFTVSHDDAIIGRKIALKKQGIFAAPDSGTEILALPPEKQHIPSLSDTEILTLARLGRNIEAGMGGPQDIEWCLADGRFYILQSRPITTLFPIPQNPDNGNHVYISVGHQQMMTDPIKPLGLSFYLLTTVAPMRTAGGRLFVDVAPMLAAPASRQKMLETLGQSDLLMKDALLTIINRGDFIPAEDSAPNAKSLPPAFFQPPIGIDPDIVPGLIRRSQHAIAALQNDIRSKTGPALLDFIRENCGQLQKELTDPQNLPVILTAMGAYTWLNEKMSEWLGEKNAGDTLSLSAPGNVTAEMGLALLDVADLIRPFPAVVAHLQQSDGSRFPEDLRSFEGGETIVAAIREFLDRYGMRCPGEIDITKPRWAENPSALIPLLLANIRNTAPGESKRRFEQGKMASENMERSLLLRLEALPDGHTKAAETKHMIGLLRSYTGYREYPKYAMISRYFIYKQALLREAESLVQAGAIADKEDIYFLSFDELREVSATHKPDASRIRERKEAYRHYEKLIPPRVITSDGEILNGNYHRDHLPPGALAGLPVSPGTVEGRARVILQMESANLQPGDILVTAFTDPSWTPVFVTIKGLVTEVGGLMTHGAVIAREYGLPAVVAVDGATRLIRDGQRIRVNGTDGVVEILED